tara:strand:- start:504 stop:782 length:279 start_codon:yes stop_codon:yes gene_type:complete
MTEIQNITDLNQDIFSEITLQIKLINKETTARLNKENINDFILFVMGIAIEECYGGDDNTLNEVCIRPYDISVCEEQYDDDLEQGESWWREY